METTKQTTSTIEINTTYHTGAISRITFEDGKTWNDVKDWYIKWDTLYVLFEGEDVFEEFTLDSYSDADSTDWKRPIHVSIYPVTEEGVDYDTDYTHTK